MTSPAAAAAAAVETAIAQDGRRVGRGHDRPTSDRFDHTLTLDGKHKRHDSNHHQFSVVGGID